MIFSLGQKPSSPAFHVKISLVICQHLEPHAPGSRQLALTYCHLLSHDYKTRHMVKGKLRFNTFLIQYIFSFLPQKPYPSRENGCKHTCAHSQSSSRKLYIYLYKQMDPWVFLGKKLEKGSHVGPCVHMAWMGWSRAAIYTQGRSPSVCSTLFSSLSPPPPPWHPIHIKGLTPV